MGGAGGDSDLGNLKRHGPTAGQPKAPRWPSRQGHADVVPAHHGDVLLCVWPSPRTLGLSQAKGALTRPWEAWVTPCGCGVLVCPLKHTIIPLSVSVSVSVSREAWVVPCGRVVFWCVLRHTILPLSVSTSMSTCQCPLVYCRFIPYSMRNMLLALSR